MNGNHGNETGSVCEQARARMHQVLDGDLLDAAVRRDLDEHVATCAGCAETFAELQRVQTALRALPELPMSEEAFAEVLDRTVRGGRRSRVKRLVFDWRTVAAAAAVIAALWAVWPSSTQQADPAGADQAEVAQADVERAQAEARAVLMLTAQALRSSQRVALREVADEVAPALRRVPINLPPAPENEEL